MKTSFQSASRLVRLLLLGGACTQAADTATRHELWVPTQHWETVLAKHPNAVMLTPEQYEALIRDAGKVKAAPPHENLPARAIVESLHFKGNAADENAGDLKLEGEMTLRCFTDEWSEVTARLPFRNLAAATVDGGVVLGLPEEIQGDKAPATQRKLLVRGKGVHHITMQVLGRASASGFDNTRGLGFQTVDVPAVLDLQLPPGAVIVRAGASYTREGDMAHVLLHATTAGVREIAWSISNALTQPPRQSYAQGQTLVTDHSVESDWNIEIQRSPGDPSHSIVFDVIPADAIVLSVEGESITHWQQTGGRLEVTLHDHTPVAALGAKVQSVLDLQSSSEAQSVAVPTLRFVGQLDTNIGTRIAGIAEGVTLMEYQGAVPLLQGYVGWNPVRDTLKVLLRKADPRLTVDADAHVLVTRDDVKIDRTLRVETDRPVNELRVTLPLGEEFISTSSTQGPALDWKRAGQVLEYHWAQGLAAGQACLLTLQSRKRLGNSTASGAPAASSITVESLVIAEAKKLAGYVALDFDPTWRVAVKTASGLEERDARLTPVQGKMAWFGLRVFSLAFEVQRREPVFDVEIAAYALPRVKTVDIEGQITLEVSDAPLRQLKVAFSKEQAALVRFTGPSVGEQTLEAASGVWSLTLRKESMGRVPLHFRLSLPAGETASAPDKANITINAKMPAITVNGARRSHGVWVVEANTDTELTFVPQAMQPLDVLRAPVIEDYQPRHRVVAAFDYASPDSALTLHAARHGHSELAALVVQSMHLTSVLGSDGSSRHEAVLSVTHSGEQFITVDLPQGSRLITTLAGHQPVKPVRGPGGSLSIPLPAGSANDPSVEVRLLYDRAGDAWTGRGQQHLDPPTLPGNIPILATDWQVYVPDGYSFKKVHTALEQDVPGATAEPCAAVAAADRFDRPASVPPFPAGREIEPSRSGVKDAELMGALNNSVRDHQRARMLRQVDEAWEDKGPAPLPAVAQKLQTIRLPEVTLREVSVAEALEYLRVKSQDMDSDANPASRGVNIILNTGDAPSTAVITLDLKDVPLEEALRYVTELAGMKFTLESNAVVVRPITVTASEMGGRKSKEVAGEDETRKQGLLPLEIDLPAAGQLLHFHGPLAPTPLALPYVSADRQILNAMVFMLAGAGLFLLWGWRRPVLASLLALLILALGIGLVTEEWQPLANATLMGWFIAVALAGMWRLVKAFDTGVMEGRQA